MFATVRELAEKLRGKNAWLAQENKIDWAESQ
jgi:hypothetical protein